MAVGHYSLRIDKATALVHDATLGVSESRCLWSQRARGPRYAKDSGTCPMTRNFLIMLARRFGQGNTRGMCKSHVMCTHGSQHRYNTSPFCFLVLYES